MSTPIKILMVVCVFIFATIVVARLTEALQVYNIPAPSNEPTVKTGEIILATNLIKPERFDFIVFRQHNSEFGDRFIFRVCGINGDKIEIRNGTLFVNGSNAYRNLNLNFLYTLSARDFNILDEKYPVEEEAYFFSPRADSAFVFTDNKTLASLGIKAERNIRLEPIDRITELFKRPWGSNQFGPIAVPEGKYFVLGDNRDNAMDSRFIGLVDEADYLGTVLGKK